MTETHRKKAGPDDLIAQAGKPREKKEDVKRGDVEFFLLHTSVNFPTP